MRFMRNLKNLPKMLPVQLIHFLIVIVGLYVLAGFSGCDFGPEKQGEPQQIWDTLTVTASAYNSLEYQTGTGNPAVTAWGDTLTPGTKVIAVSRDLIQKGLDYNTAVRIEGLDGIYYVKDKMHYRWKNKIDIYMGEDVQEAREWGVKKVKIYYLVDNDSLINI